MVAAGLVALGLVVAIFNVWTGYVHERRRSEPIVIAHEEGGRTFTDDPAYFAVGGFITSEGGGPAFNVRFGVEYRSVRFPQKMVPEDPDAGNVHRVVRDRLPPQGSWPVLVPRQMLMGLLGDKLDELGDKLDENRTYWARYENARGQTWETRNPWNRSARLEIRRVRAVALRQWLEQRRREKVGALGKENETKAMKEALTVFEALNRMPDDLRPFGSASPKGG